MSRETGKEWNCVKIIELKDKLHQHKVDANAASMPL